MRLIPLLSAVLLSCAAGRTVPAPVVSSADSVADAHAGARALLREREFEKAISVLERSVQQSEEDLEARRLLGRALLGRGAAEFAEHELAWGIEALDLVATREYLAAVVDADGAPRRAVYAALMFAAMRDDAFARLSVWVWVNSLGEDAGPAPIPANGVWPAMLAKVLDGTSSEAELWRSIDAQPPEIAKARRCAAHYLLGEAARGGVGPWRSRPDEEAARLHLKSAVRTGAAREESFALAEFLLDRV